jgi:hypothetical protein
MHRGIVHTRFWWRNLRERDTLEDLVIYGKVKVKWIVKK